MRKKEFTHTSILLIAGICMVLMSGCSFTKKDENDVEIIALIEEATQLEENNQFVLASNKFQKVYQQVGNPDYLFKAVEMLLSETNASYLHDAKMLLIDKLDDSDLTPNANVKKLIFLGDIAEQQQDVEFANQIADELASNNLQIDEVTIAIRQAGLERRIALLTMLNRKADLVSALVTQDNLYSNDITTSKKNRAALWRALEETEKSDREIIRAKYTHQENLTGWLDLTVRSKRFSKDYNQFLASTKEWQKKYPDHPAQSSILPQILEISRSISGEIRSIAIMLPAASTWDKISNAIRDGFLSAWYTDSKKTRKPKIVFYSTNAENVVTTYRNILSEGTDFIIGPVDKTSVNKLISEASIERRTLLLNRPTENNTTTSNHPLLYSFALSSEEEIEAIVKKASSQGKQNIITLAPQNDWGKQLVEKFHNDWINAGGTILRHVFYPSNAASIPSVIQNFVLHDYETRPQQEEGEKILPLAAVDAIFMLGYSSDIAQIVPQIHFFARNHVPIIYTTSHVLQTKNRVTTAISLKKINGVLFPDIPWVLNQKSKAVSHITLQKNIQIDTSPYIRLYAMGADAYHLAFALPFMKNNPARYRMKGGTGTLSLSKTGELKRTLNWGKIENGNIYLVP